MPDFSRLLKAPAGEARRPVPLTPGNYPGVIKRWEPVEAPQGKNYTSMIRVHVAPTGWPDEVPAEDRMQDLGKGLEAIDLSKRQLKKDFYDHQLIMLDDFLRSLQIDLKGRSYEETLPEMIGKPVVMEVQQYLNQRTNEIGNQVNNITGAL